MDKKTKINLLQKVTIDSSQLNDQFGQNSSIRHEKTLTGVIEARVHTLLKEHKWCAILTLVLCRIKASDYFSKLTIHLPIRL